VRKLTMRILFTTVILFFASTSFSYREICFVGATPNFFKAGYSAIRDIASRYPEAHIRLGLISEIGETPPIVKDLEISGKLSFHTWPRGDKRKVKSTFMPTREISAEMDALVQFFHGCTAAFLVPPIDHRVAIGRSYAKAVAIARVPYAVVLGVQYAPHIYREKYGEEAPQIALDAEELYAAMELIFEKYSSPIKYIIFHTPMFLENILYQTQRLQNYQAFYWPLTRNAEFAYITCKDLGKIVSQSLVEFEEFISRYNHINKKIPEKRADISLVGGTTNAAQLEKYFKEIVNNNIIFKEQTRESFVKELRLYLDKSEEGAETIAELYDEIKKGRDLLDLDTTIIDLLHTPPQSAQEWIKEHRACFIKESSSTFPLPPPEHQAPIPPEWNTL